MTRTAGEPNLALAKKLNIAAWIITAIVMSFVVMMRRIHLDFGFDVTILPPVYSSLNALVAVLLIVGLVMIKRKNRKAHQLSMTSAMIISALFLVMYVIYHMGAEETLYCKEGGIRIVYFVLLISHIVLAAVILPLVLFTYIRAWTGQLQRHRKMAKWVFPIWLYVAITGPVIYLMLLPCYGN